MPRKYIKHPPQGYNNFLVFVIRYAYFNRYVIDGKVVMGINQIAFSKFLGVKQPSISNYVKLAKTSGFLECIKEVHYFSKKQKRPSKLYALDYLATLNYLLSNKIDPLEDLIEAEKQVKEYGKSLISVEKRIKRERADSIRQKSILRDYCHGRIFNQIIREYNAELEQRGLGYFADRYLDDLKFRANNVLCSTPNPENHKDDFFFDDNRRMQLLKAFGLKYPVEHDVNAAIYRLTYNLNNETQLSQKADVYELFWNALKIGKPFTKEARKHFKKICMPIYMMEQGIKTSWYNQIKAELNHTVFPTKQARERFDAYVFLQEYTGIDLEMFLVSLAKAMKDVMGVEKFYGRDIFLYESGLYAQMKLKLIDRGILVINCYDGFYGSRGVFTKDVFLKTYYEATEILKSVVATRDKLMGGPVLYMQDTDDDLVSFY